MQSNEDTLRSRFDLTAVLRDLHAVLISYIPYDRIGVALPHDHGRQFRTVAVVSGGGANAQGGRFPSKGSVAAWIREHDQPFLVQNLDDLAPFPTTRETMIRRGMRSSCAMPIKARQEFAGVLFVLASEPDRFNSLHTPGLARVAAVLGGVMQAGIAARALLEPDAPSHPAPPRGVLEAKLPTLEDVQRHYIGVVLDETRGVIEGRNGAAAILGVAPSTLRHKLDRLQIQRPRHD